MNESLVFTRDVDIAIFGIDVEDGTKFGGTLLRKLENHDVLMNIVSWGEDFSNNMPIVKFFAKSESELIEFGMDLYDVDEEQVREIFF